MKELNLTSWVKIDNTAIFKDGEELFHFSDEATSADNLKLAYKELNVDYAKFFKMDGLSKLGLLASDLLLTDSVKNQYQDDEIAVLLSNRTSSLQSDTDHVTAYTEKTASPAIFVYTLPNIVVGEICIRHKLLGESNFYIFENFNAPALLEQAELLIATTQTKACLAGWVEYTDQHFEAFLFLLEENGAQKATPQLLEKIKDTQY